MSEIILEQDQIETANSARTRSAIRAGVFGIICNLGFFMLKLALALLSGSVAVMADAFNNLADAGSSLVVAVGFRVAARKPDRSHPFGYQRMEYICGLLMGLLIVMTGLGICREALARFWNPSPLEGGIVVVAGLLLSIAGKLALGWYYKRTNRRVNSPNLTTAAVDCISDAVVTAGTLAALILAPYTGWPLDAIVGLGVALVIMLAGAKAVGGMMHELLGASPEPEMTERLRDAILAVPGVRGVQEIAVYDYGPTKKNASAHVEISLNIELLEAHHIVERAMAQVKKQTGVNLLVQIVPVMA
jgi:cation diffusion facilitator family transporter